MSNPIVVRRALLSVSDKTDLVPFARALVQSGVEIISTGGTARALAEAGIEVTPIDRVTGFPEMLDGRVKTLHPLVHGGLLGRRDLPEHVEAMKAHGIEPIDLVCINLYPFEQTVAREEVSDAEAIEQIDIGGPAMVRSASKNHAFVAVVTSVAQYDRVIDDLAANEGATSLELRRDLAAAAFMRTAEYDTAIAAWMTGAGAETLGPMFSLHAARQGLLRYGENPHQEAAVYSDPARVQAGIATAPLLHGKPVSYNNLLDASAAIELVGDLQSLRPDGAAAAVVKHTNPCGAAIDDDPVAAFEKAYAGDPMAAFGGILAMSVSVEDDLAETIAEGQRFLEVIAAPAFSDGAVKTLGARWKNVRLVRVTPPSSKSPRRLAIRSILGGFLVQQRDVGLVRPADWKHVAGPTPTAALLDEASVLWVVAKHLKSNAIAIGTDGMLLGAGAGQMDRVTACRLAIRKSGDRLGEGTSAIAASDAFFPFPDGPELLVDAGVRCIVHPGGSKRDGETEALCDERGVTCLVTGRRHFRH